MVGLFKDALGPTVGPHSKILRERVPAPDPNSARHVRDVGGVDAHLATGVGQWGYRVFEL